MADNEPAVPEPPPPGVAPGYDDVPEITFEKLKLRAGEHDEGATQVWFQKAVKVTVGDKEVEIGAFLGFVKPYSPDGHALPIWRTDYAGSIVTAAGKVADAYTSAEDHPEEWRRVFERAYTMDWPVFGLEDMPKRYHEMV